jgi:hypothetical protein
MYNLHDTRDWLVFKKLIKIMNCHSVDFRKTGLLSYLKAYTDLPVKKDDVWHILYLICWSLTGMISAKHKKVFIRMLSLHPYINYIFP